MAQPMVYWVPSIAPSGLLYVTGDKYPDLAGKLITSALVGMRLRVSTLEGDEVSGEADILEELNLRFRHVAQGPDGFIYLATDADDGVIYRLETL